MSQMDWLDDFMASAKELKVIASEKYRFELNRIWMPIRDFCLIPSSRFKQKEDLDKFEVLKRATGFEREVVKVFVNTRVPSKNEVLTALDILLGQFEQSIADIEWKRWKGYERIPFARNEAPLDFKRINAKVAASESALMIELFAMYCKVNDIFDDERIGLQEFRWFVVLPSGRTVKTTWFRRANRTKLFPDMISI